MIVEPGSISDLLATYDVVELPARLLREGMLVVDPDFHCPLYVLDHSIAGHNGHRAGAWMVEDLQRDGGPRWSTFTFLRDRTYPVATGIAAD